ncbi:MAG: glycosyltransferase family 2 protein [Candidatus Natronoplasma sp.]
MITAVIPAYNEEDRIEKVLKETSQYVDDIIVVDDSSTDGTVQVAEEFSKVTLLRNEENLGYLRSLRRGFGAVEGEIIVTIDADGEHDPSFIPDLVSPIEEGEADLVFGKRESIPRWSERLISKLAKLRAGVEDTGTGLRALRKSLAERMELHGYCTCGTFALEAVSLGASVTEVKAPVREVEKAKKIAWQHFFQFFVVLWWVTVRDLLS